jgi:hypothetical protein
MFRQALYSDPVGRGQKNLIEGLMSVPTTTAQRPIENQFSEVLAWLIGRSDQFARRLALNCSRDSDKEWQIAVREAARIGARTRITLATSTGALFPDISVEGANRKFQLLLEVKIDTDFHEAEVDGQFLLQPDAYAVAWRALGEAEPARVRRVSTLTKTAPDLAGADDWRQAAITWQRVTELLEASLAAKDVPTEALAVAQEYNDAIRMLILKPGPDPSDVQHALANGKPLIDQFAERLLHELEGATSRRQAQLYSDYVSRYVQVPGGESGPLTLWLFATAPGASYALPGDAASSACIQLYGAAQGVVLSGQAAARAVQAGFRPIRDNKGFVGHRRIHPIPLSADQASIGQAVEELWIDIERLRSVSLI